MAMVTIHVENPNSYHLIIGKVNSHFVVDIYDALTKSIPDIEFGIWFNEILPDNLQKYVGTKDELIQLSEGNAENLAAKDTFVLTIEHFSAKEIMQALKKVPEIREIYCATTSPIEILLAESEKGRFIMGLADDYAASRARKHSKVA